MDPERLSLESLNNILASIKANTGKSLPPVDQWNPDYCGEMNLELKANGDWLHDGSVIKRKKLIQLFSTILKKENEQYFLVSPVEKIGIKVEWQPFVIIDFDLIKNNGKDCYLFIDNCGNKTLLTSVEQIIFSEYKKLTMPILKIRKNLYASFNRSSYYRLIEQAHTLEMADTQKLTINSMGLSFCVGILKKE